MGGKVKESKTREFGIANVKKVKNSIINRELTFPIKIGSHNITASPGDSVSSAFYYNKKHYGFIPALIYFFPIIYSL